MTDESLGDVVLVHHGVKGMKWGVRKVRTIASENTPRARRAAGEARVADRQTHASSDHKEVAAKLEKAKAHGTSALSNEDLRKVNDRLNLEQNFSRLTTPQKSAGRKYAENLIKTDGQQAVKNAAKKHIAKQIAKKAAIATLL
jgi:hypothetical protein